MAPINFFYLLLLLPFAIAGGLIFSWSWWQYLGFFALNFILVTIAMAINTELFVRRLDKDLEDPKKRKEFFKKYNLRKELTQDMDKKELLELIPACIDYLVPPESGKYWEHVLTKHSYTEVVGSLNELLGDNDPEIVGHSLLFIRDLMLLAPEIGFKKEFQRDFYNSSLVNQLESMVRAPILGIREDAIYTLGKTGCSQSLPYLKEVFEQIKESDPICASGLAFEINWLSEEAEMKYFIEQCSDTTSPMTRWYCLDRIRNYDYQPGGEGYKSKLSFVLACVDDSNIYVKNTAQYIHFEMLNKPKLGLEDDDKVYQKLYREMIRRSPHDFDHLRVSFGKRMYEEKKLDYELNELIEFSENEFIKMYQPFIKEGL